MSACCNLQKIWDNAHNRRLSYDGTLSGQAIHTNVVATSQSTVSSSRVVYSCGLTIAILIWFLILSDPLKTFCWKLALLFIISLCKWDLWTNIDYWTRPTSGLLYTVLRSRDHVVPAEWDCMSRKTSIDQLLTSRLMLLSGPIIQSSRECLMRLQLTLFCIHEIRLVTAKSIGCRVDAMS